MLKIFSQNNINLKADKIIAAAEGKLNGSKIEINGKNSASACFKRNNRS